jgi:hypothetical protein
MQRIKWAVSSLSVNDKASTWGPKDQEKEGSCHAALENDPVSGQRVAGHPLVGSETLPISIIEHNGNDLLIAFTI